ncbi:hypothetical protein PSN45_002856 [Yamadazyma tenuis]|uniref:Uncharacterized protein n=1 Tax=Candida tenuis (strain ATCC 10573 / BCRC 21748 / CBS 615 / JCM 9827 / NBRC 10315 / NRRL Y-1498 / VKM Y-70) TaxID=590646 RepID=G3AWG9_CANTC|nr:uncharacterized protein CANTEDRAFT_112257 [Yamadazyma tenuis ATCC 10573]EGV66539.1 hypothetical protein CANTEDRAFT_112257 [Yamadazyma tenuis ATCC 10573]WEJ95341.1 hypothetical protein PSN45_002856 [Yamadazyma tenuis]
MADFRISKILDNVPASALRARDDSRDDVLNFIDYSDKFVSQFDKYRYVIHTDSDEFQSLNNHMMGESREPQSLQWFHRAVTRISDQVRLVAQILRRHKIYTIYSLETKFGEFLVVVDVGVDLPVMELTQWISEFQTMKFRNKRSWCDNLDYFHTVKFIVLGEDVGRSCDELINTEDTIDVKDEL